MDWALWLVIFALTGKRLRLHSPRTSHRHQTPYLDLELAHPFFLRLDAVWGTQLIATQSPGCLSSRDDNSIHVDPSNIVTVIIIYCWVVLALQVRTPFSSSPHTHPPIGMC
jgi:hypothetical protein